MADSADPDQLASSEASWSGSTLFAKAGLELIFHSNKWEKEKGLAQDEKKYTSK